MQACILSEPGVLLVPCGSHELSFAWLCCPSFSVCLLWVGLRSQLPRSKEAIALKKKTLSSKP